MSVQPVRDRGGCLGQRGARWLLRSRASAASVPDRVVKNDEVAALCGVDDEWVRTRSGISERRIAGEGENTLTLATAASREALADAGIEPGEVDHDHPRHLHALHHDPVHGVLPPARAGLPPGPLLRPGRRLQRLRLRPGDRGQAP